MTSVKPQEIAELLFSSNSASLATLDHQSQTPYASLVNVSVDDHGPILLISDLAWHTKNLSQHSAGSLLFVTNIVADGSSDPLQALRVTVLGQFQKADDVQSREDYLHQHPSAKMYEGFADFSFWRLKPKTLHAIAGFGAISTYNAGQIFSDDASSLV